MASSGSNMSSTKDASTGIDSAKINSKEESAKVIQTVQTVDISRSVGQCQDVKRPVEIVHEIPAKEASTTKKE